MKYRTKPVVKEAFRFLYDDMPEWCIAKQLDETITTGYEYLIIHTLEGDMRADVGDWIIKGVNGELYPCKDDIFRKTYEPVTDEAEVK